MSNEDNFGVVGSGIAERQESTSAWDLVGAKVEVEIVEAHGLTGSGSIDPYALVEVQEAEYKTKQLIDSNNPRWREKHEFSVIDIPTAKGLVLIYARRFGRSDALLARYVLDFSKIAGDNTYGRFVLFEALSEKEREKRAKDSKWTPAELTVNLRLVECPIRGNIDSYHNRIEVAVKETEALRQQEAADEQGRTVAANQQRLAAEQEAEQAAAATTATDGRAPLLQFQSGDDGFTTEHQEDLLAAANTSSICNGSIADVTHLEQYHSQHFGHIEDNVVEPGSFAGTGEFNDPSADFAAGATLVTHASTSMFTPPMTTTTDTLAAVATERAGEEEDQEVTNSVTPQQCNLDDASGMVPQSTTTTATTIAATAATEKEADPARGDVSPVIGSNTTTVTSSSFRDRIEEFYKAHNVARSGADIERIAMAWKGHEGALFNSLVAKYGTTEEQEAHDATKPKFEANPIFKKRLTEFYTNHAPEKLSSVNIILETYQGKEEMLFQMLEQRYAAEGEDDVRNPYRPRLECFFAVYSPEKLPTVYTILKMYKAREEWLFATLIKKYGPEPVEDGWAALLESGLVSPESASHWSYTQRLKAFYERFAPEKVSKVEEALVAFKGKEELLFQQLESHYCKKGVMPNLHLPATPVAQSSPKFENSPGSSGAIKTKKQSSSTAGSSLSAPPGGPPPVVEFVDNDDDDDDDEEGDFNRANGGSIREPATPMTAAAMREPRGGGRGAPEPQLLSDSFTLNDSICNFNPEAKQAILDVAARMMGSSTTTTPTGTPLLASAAKTPTTSAKESNVEGDDEEEEPLETVVLEKDDEEAQEAAECGTEQADNQVIEKDVLAEIPPPILTSLDNNAAATTADSSSSCSPGGEISAESPSSSFAPRERLVRFYVVYCPEKLTMVDRALETYSGDSKVMELFAALVGKYGPEPSSEVVEAANAKNELMLLKQDITKWLIVAGKPNEDVDAILAKYHGKEGELREAMLVRYGPVPTSKAVADAYDRTSSQSVSPPPAVATAMMDPPPAYNPNRQQLQPSSSGSSGDVVAGSVPPTLHQQAVPLAGGAGCQQPPSQSGYGIPSPPSQQNQQFYQDPYGSSVGYPPMQQQQQQQQGGSGYPAGGAGYFPPQQQQGLYPQRQQPSTTGNPPSQYGGAGGGNV